MHFPCVFLSSYGNCEQSGHLKIEAHSFFVLPPPLHGAQNELFGATFLFYLPSHILKGTKGRGLAYTLRRNGDRAGLSPYFCQERVFEVQSVESDEECTPVIAVDLGHIWERIPGDGSVQDAGPCQVPDPRCHLFTSGITFVAHREPYCGKEKRCWSEVPLPSAAALPAFSDLCSPGFLPWPRFDAQEGFCHRCTNPISEVFSKAYRHCRRPYQPHSHRTLICIDFCSHQARFSRSGDL